MNGFSKIASALIFLLSISLTQLSAQEKPKPEQSKDTSKQTGTTKILTKEGKAGNIHGKGFVDEDGDGYNDNAPDHDGDGIPNGLDSDYQKSKAKKGKRGFVDLDGDGIDDNIGPGKGKSNKGNKAKFDSKFGNKKSGAGPQDGTGNNSGSGNGGNDGSKGNKNQSKGKGKGGS